MARVAAVLTQVRAYRAQLNTSLNTSSALRLAGVALLAILLGVLLIARIASAHDVTTKVGGNSRLVGSAVPDLTLPLWNGTPGQTLELAALKGHPVVLNFWEASCDPCQAEAPLLASTWRANQAKGVLFIGVALETSEQDGLAFLREHGITYPNGPADTEDVAVRYALIGAPVTYFIDRQGVVVGHNPGQLSATTLNQGIEQALG